MALLLTKFFSEPLPPPVEVLLADRTKVKERFPPRQPRTWRISRLSLPGVPRDSPSASLYRIYQFVVADLNVQLRNELEYFCTIHPDWAVAGIPDPADTRDPLRYAALAALTYLLCEAFNRRIELGLPRDAPPIVEDWEELAQRPKILEHVPGWAERVQPLAKVVRIPDAKGNIVEADDMDVCVPFKKLNILIGQPHIHFV
jgi:hypothetical protein